MRRQAQHGQLGQFDPSAEPIIMDVQYPDSGIQTLDNPDILSTHGYYDYGASSAPSVPQPSSPTSTGILATFGPYGTLDPTATGTMAPTSPGSAPAPRVPSKPSSTPTSVLSSIPMVAWIGIGVVGILALSGGGGRRRR